MALTKVDQTMVSDQVFGRRNFIINGDMRVAQRATSAAVSNGTNEGYATLDRWRHGLNNAAVATVSQSTTVPTGEGFANSMKIDVTTADTSVASNDFWIMNTKLEGQDLQRIKKGTSNAEKLTLSFWVRSGKTGTYIVELEDVDNSRSVALSYTISSADTWQKVELVFPADTTGAFDNDNAVSLFVSWWLVAGSNYSSGTLATTWGSQTDANRAAGQVNFFDSTSNEYYITGVQLEVGENATPFEHITYAEELTLCERYYQELPIQDRTFVQYSTGNYAYGGNINYWRPMRATPTVTNGGNGEVYPNGANRLTTSGLVSLQNPTYNRSQCSLYHTTLSNSYTGYFVRSDNIKLDAEL